MINLTFHKDLEAAHILEEYLNEIEMEDTIRRLVFLIDNKKCYVFGCGPSLEDNIKYVKEKKIIKSQDVIIAADGATKALEISEMMPDIIVTDLDGDIPALKRANKRGAIIVIHAHGDNIPNIREYANEFKMKIGTVQIKPFGLLKNFGGFTDGDRAVFLAEHFNASKISLLGFDFGEIVGKYSKKDHENDFKASEIKKIKLEIARYLIDELNANKKVVISNYTNAYKITTR